MIKLNPAQKGKLDHSVDHTYLVTATIRGMSEVSKGITTSIRSTERVELISGFAIEDLKASVERFYRNTQSSAVEPGLLRTIKSLRDASAREEKSLEALESSLEAALRRTRKLKEKVKGRCVYLNTLTENVPTTSNH